jgi:Na+-driven multidrug efflux pump
VGVIVSLFLGFGLIFFGRTVVSLYNRTPEIVSLGGRLLIMAGVIQPLQALQFILSGALRGAGDTKFSAFSMLVTVLILRSGLAILLVTYLKMGLVGAWYAMVADQIVRDLMIILYFRSGRWSRIRLKEV